MAPIGILYTNLGPARAMKALAAAKIGNVELTIAPDFTLGTDNKTDAFLAKFPLGKIPAFETPSGFLLTESTAIAEYVARKGSARAQLLGATDEEAALIRQWVCFADSHLQDAVAQLSRWRLGYGEYDARVEASCEVDLRRWMGYMEGHLKKGGSSRWLASGELGPTLADLAVGMVVYFGLMGYFDEEFRKEYPEVMGWYQRLVEYPGMGEYYDVPNKVDVRKAPPS